MVSKLIGKEKESGDKNSFIDKVQKLVSPKEVKFTAEYAWLETYYGEGSYRSLEERIKDKQANIKRLIESKFPARGSATSGIMTYGSYRCIVDIEDDLAEHIDEIFKPFIDGGFKIINLSEKIDEIEDEHVFLISWKKTFKKEKTEV